MLHRYCRRVCSPNCHCSSPEGRADRRWALAHSDADELAARLGSEEGPFPWVRYLPPSDREQFVRDLAEALRTAADLGNYAAFDLTVEQWRHSAEIWADPELAETLTKPVKKPLAKRVPRARS